jgi:hypothetical protein
MIALDQRNHLGLFLRRVVPLFVSELIEKRSMYPLSLLFRNRPLPQFHGYPSAYLLANTVNEVLDKLDVSTCGKYCFELLVRGRENAVGRVVSSVNDLDVFQL